MSAGKTELILQIDPDNASSVSVDVLTRDGRHLVGEPDTAALTSVVGQSSFFGSGATYSDSYLNLSGASEGAYKDLEISYGAFGQTSEVTKLLPLPLDAVNAPATTDFAGGYIDFTTGTTDKAVLTIASDSSIDETEGAISIRNDAIYRGTGTGSEQIGTVVYPYGVSNPSYDTLRVTFSNAVTGINVPVLNEIAAAFTYSARKDLTTSSNPVISNISVEAVTSDESEQFASVYDFNSADLIEAGRVLDDDGTDLSSWVRASHCFLATEPWSCSRIGSRSMGLIWVRSPSGHRGSRDMGAYRRSILRRGLMPRPRPM